MLGKSSRHLDRHQGVFNLMQIQFEHQVYQSFTIDSRFIIKTISMRENPDQSLYYDSQQPVCRFCSCPIGPNRPQQRICPSCTMNLNPLAQVCDHPRYGNSRSIPLPTPNVRYIGGQESNQMGYRPVRLSPLSNSQQPDHKIEYYPVENINLDHRQNSTDNCAIFYAFLFAQASQAVVNIFLSLTTPLSKCMDSPNDMVVRRWMLSIGTAETALVLALLLVLLLYRRDFIEVECYSRVLLGLGAAGVMKGVVWGVATIILFTTRISKHCDGFIYDYGLLLVIFGAIHLIVVAALPFFISRYVNIY